MITAGFCASPTNLTFTPFLENKLLRRLLRRATISSKDSFFLIITNDNQLNKEKKSNSMVVNSGSNRDKYSQNYYTA
jgi:hypothetical protein